MKEYPLDEAQTLPTSRSEIFRLLDFCAAVKTKLIKYVMDNYAREVQAQLAAVSQQPVTEFDLERAVESIIYDHRTPDGKPVIDIFIQDSQLTPQETTLLSRWREPILGIFHLGDRDGPVGESVNLVDSLPYRLVATKNSQNLRQIWSARGFLISRIVPVLDAWMLSGSQHILKASEKRIAYGRRDGPERAAPILSKSTRKISSDF